MNRFFVFDRILPRAICSSEVVSNVVVQMEVSSDTSNSSLTTSKHKRAFGCSTKRSLLKQPLNKDLKPLRALLSSTTQDASASVVNGGKIGVLLLNLGGPETLDDVQPFLFNLFADPVYSYFLQFFFFFPICTLYAKFCKRVILQTTS